MATAEAVAEQRARLLRNQRLRMVCRLERMGLSDLLTDVAAAKELRHLGQLPDVNNAELANVRFSDRECAELFNMLPAPTPDDPTSSVEAVHRAAGS